MRDSEPYNKWGMDLETNSCDIYIQVKLYREPTTYFVPIILERTTAIVQKRPAELKDLRIKTQEILSESVDLWLTDGKYFGVRTDNDW